MANPTLSNALKEYKDVEGATQPAVLLDGLDPLTKLEQESITLTQPRWEAPNGNLATKQVTLLEGVVGKALIDSIAEPKKNETAAAYGLFLVSRFWEFPRGLLLDFHLSRPVNHCSKTCKAVQQSYEL